ncbi:hypothetical protein [Flammeovirga aprica]|uniref:DUF3108 domain-containing protein n=1 Tax=Flammeovirga aprica JL-4 TaxID=694437 RepID=A0A7X9S0I2_9BACT|nr:hypothetical protein [Flammeovirga aprica]NME72110.1 hypothetical protein [Flammeovirga aprica JL-4]
MNNLARLFILLASLFLVQNISVAQTKKINFEVSFWQNDKEIKIKKMKGRKRKMVKIKKAPFTLQVKFYNKTEDVYLNTYTHDKVMDLDLNSSLFKNKYFKIGGATSANKETYKLWIESIQFDSEDSDDYGTFEPVYFSYAHDQTSFSEVSDRSKEIVIGKKVYDSYVYFPDSNLDYPIETIDDIGYDTFYMTFTDFETKWDVVLIFE